MNFDNKINMKKPIININSIHNIKKIAKGTKRQKCKVCHSTSSYFCNDCESNCFLHSECFNEYHLKTYNL